MREQTPDRVCASKIKMPMLDEVILAVASLQLEDLLLAKLLDIFHIDYQQYYNTRTQVLENRELPSLNVAVKSVKIKNLHPSREDKGLECRIRFENGAPIQAHKINSKEWTLPSSIPVDNLISNKLEVEIWYENEKVSKDGSFFLRSLDTIGRKLKSSLANSGLSDTNGNKDDLYDDDEDECRAKRSSLNLRENKWISGAFATLKRHKKNLSTSSKPEQEKLNREFEEDNGNLHYLDHKWNDKERFLDMESSILTPKDNQACKTFCSSEPSKKPSIVSVIEKPEVNVKRQLFKTESVGLLENFQRFSSSLKEKSKNSEQEFSNIPLNDSESPLSNLISRNNKETDEYAASNRLGKFQSMTFSRGSLGPNWRRTSLSSLDSWSQKSQRQRRKKEDVFDFLSPAFKNLSSPLAEKSFLFKTNSKEKIVNASIGIKEAFMKMTFCKWTLEERDVAQSLKKPENVFLSPESISVVLELCFAEKFPEIERDEVLTGLLDILLEKDKELKLTEAEYQEFGTVLPLSKESKAILKCMAFSLNVPDSQFSYITWKALTRREPKNEKTICDKKTSIISSPKNKPNIGSSLVTARIHPQIIYYWLTKIERIVCCSEFNAEEMELVSASLTDLVNDFSLKFSRLHASYALSRSSHLQYTLRCVKLMTESQGIHSMLKQCDNPVFKNWPKQVILFAVEKHAANWTKALTTEPTPRNSAVEDFDIIPNGLFVHPLHKAIRRCEQAILCINDFIILAEKVYEPTFQSELNESYLKIMWKKIGPSVLEFLDPIWNNSRCSDSDSIPISIHDLYELHASIWILVLQLSKLQRFQNAEGRWDILEVRFPTKFQESFCFLVKMWLTICFSKMEDALRLEMKEENLEASSETCSLSSSAIELIDKFVVLQEKICSLSLPDDQESSSQILEHLFDKICELLETYQTQLCRVAIAKSTVKDAISPQISVSIFNLKKVTTEAEKLIGTICSKETQKTFVLNSVVRKAAYLMFSQSLPRLSSKISNVLIKHDKKCSTIISNWIQTFVNSVANVLPSATSTLQYFWDFLFIILQEQQKTLTKIREVQYLGELMENIYYYYKTVLRIELFEESEKEFHSIMENIKLQTSSTAELIQMFYNQRIKEQQASPHTHNRIIVNSHFLRGKGLCLDLHMGPLITEETPKVQHRRSSWSITNAVTEKLLPKISDQSQDMTHRSLPRRRFQQHINLISKLELINSRASSEYYVKVKLEPEEWFKGVQERKSKKDKRNPPVFDSEMIFSKVRSECEGIRKGGFVVLRLKAGSSEVLGEAIMLLKDVPLVTADDRRKVKHSYLTLTKPTQIHNYPSLVELSTRKYDKAATKFLRRLQGTYFDSQTDTDITS